MSNKPEGWIKLHRQIMESDTFSRLTLVQKLIAIYILLDANYEKSIWYDKYKDVEVEVHRGETVISRNKIANEWFATDKEVTEQKVRTTLRKLEKLNFLTIESTKHYTKLKVHNYDFYQERNDKDNQADNQEETKHQPSDNHKQEEPRRTKNKESVPFAEIINHLNAKTGKKFSAKSEANKKLIRARWNEGRSQADFIHVIDIKCSDWLQDSKMFEYLRPSTLFRQQNFEKYVNQNQQPPPKKRPADPRDKEIAIQKWMQAGGDPDEFSWDAYNNWTG
ncbi:conserved phage C-terminal domain-containing protein [Salibacterium lacus]|uniref:Conserved phage C-terminal domain-containing protein n=1 Tax=Salibacterium lacus TaxID=1898109 RepID=A0ABW5T139_9BACI